MIQAAVSRRVLVSSAVMVVLPAESPLVSEVVVGVFPFFGISLV